MIERTLRISGSVQKVGYRDMAREIAQGYGVVGYVGNLPDGAVEVVCQGEREIVEAFTKALEIKEEFVEVGDIGIVEEREIEELSHEFFVIRYGELVEEFGERMIEGIRYMKATRRAVDEVGKKVEGVGEKVEGVGKKVEGVGENVKSVQKVTENGFNRTDEHFHNLDEKYHTVSGELRKIRKLLESGMVRGTDIAAEEKREYTTREN